MKRLESINPRLHRELTRMEGQSLSRHDLKRKYLCTQVPARTNELQFARKVVKHHLRVQGLIATQCSDKILERKYQEITNRLRKHHRFEPTVTHAELNLRKKIASYTRLKVHSSVWIGNTNVDFLIPAIRVNSNCGLVIEVDGLVHNKELKEKKDSFKLDYLQSIGLLVMGVDNFDFRKATVTCFLRNLKTIERACSRKRKNLWRRIYLETILTHASPVELKNLFGY